MQMQTETNRFKSGLMLCAIPKAGGELSNVYFEFSREITEMSNQSGRGCPNYVCSSAQDIECISVKIQATLSLSSVVETKIAKTAT